MRHCIECGNATGLVLVALPVCGSCYQETQKETRDEHFEHLRREDDQAMARRLHPAGSSPRRRARERWFPNEFLGRSGE